VVVSNPITEHFPEMGFSHYAGSFDLMILDMPTWLAWLGQLLWWLQEHTSRVLTVMTTNDRTILPPELIRSGRIDKDIYMGCLKVTEGLDFAERVLAEFIPHVNTTAPNNQSPVPTTNTYRDWLVHDIKTIYQNTETQIVAHADLIALVHDLIKARNWV
jgi:SpoVK/Ycf46/Vps4 family AAA+-type ATPase